MAPPAQVALGTAPVPLELFLLRILFSALKQTRKSPPDPEPLPVLTPITEPPNYTTGLPTSTTEYSPICNTKKQNLSKYPMQNEFSAMTETERERLLLEASKNGSLTTVQLLLDLNTRTEVRDEEGETPLLLAAAHNHFEVALALVEACADVNAGNLFGERPLHLAAPHNDARFIHLLLARGADVNARTAFKDTPLHYAAQKGAQSAVTALIRKGANPYANNEMGLTPWNIAMMHGHFQVAMQWF
ncbi:ankyrin repeat and protein kinase domain-containing protein 1-like [Periplaneta americana]|uniref:ankyrin repeat and protein kinase domain-containing protein 1-like n=1 Tax=Periplaneta americana TaxID=6978 RepID=UPI0037E949BD